MDEFLFSHDTIAAISTPVGRGAVGMVRISGPDSLESLKPLWEGKDLESLPPRQMTLGRIRTSRGDLLDEVLIVRWKSPKSYTGEDMVEVHCHGNPLILKGLLRELYSRGIRAAQPGEFTFRAFRNGRISLVQAESVAELIDAKGEWARKNALGVLAEHGDVWVRELLDSLLEIWVRVEADLEFPTDDLDSLNLEEILPSLERLYGQMAELRRRAVPFAKLQEGYRVILAGAPNVGKSSLLNALLGYQRALVTDIPGTTRDTLEESFEVDGIPIRLIDTAGLGKAKDELDEQGMIRSRQALDSADLVLNLIDASREDFPEDVECLGKGLLRHGTMPPDVPVVIVANKTDLLDRNSPWLKSDSVVPVSALKEVGLNQLLETIAEKLTENVGVDLEERLMLNDRQEGILNRAMEAIGMCIENIRAMAHQDLIATDLAEAKQALEELSGKTFQVDLMDTIFSRFCIGK